MCMTNLVYVTLFTQVCGHSESQVVILQEANKEIANYCY